MSKSKKEVGANGEILHDGDRVFTHSDGVRRYGTLFFDENASENWREWLIKFDDGGCFYVLNFNVVYSANRS